MKQTVLISGELYSNASHRPSSFRVECSNQQRSMELSVNNGTLTQINIGDLLSSISFDCCVSAIYYGNYETERRCTSTEMDLFTIPAHDQTLNQPLTTPTSTQSNSSKVPASDIFVSSDLNIRASIIIGGVLGSIIVILLLLLAICGGVLCNTLGL